MNILRCKAAIIGDPRVGKTCLINQLIKNYFNNTYQTTLGIDYNTYDAKLKDCTVQFHIMDFTGFSVFRDLIYSQIRDVNFIIYVYDATNQESFASVKLWKDSFKDYLKGKNVIEVLVANKVDLEKKIAVDENTGKQFAAQNNIKFHQTSAVIFYYIMKFKGFSFYFILKCLNFSYLVAFEKYCGVI